MEKDFTVVDTIIQKTGSEKKNLIPILQAIQAEYNYLPQEALRRVSETTRITAADIIGVASFYSQFRISPTGHHRIKVCVGTACHVKGAEQVYDAFHRELKLKEGEDTDEKREYTLEKVSCLGCCTLAPVVQVDRITYGHVESGQVVQVIRDFESRKDKKEDQKARRADGTVIEGEIRIGLGSCCVASGSGEIREAVEEAVNRNKLNVKLKHVGCVGMCHQVPLVEIVPYDSKETILYSRVNPKDVGEIITNHFKASGFLTRIKNRFLSSIENIQSDSKWDGIKRYELNIREKQVASFLGKQISIATEFRGVINPLDIEEYISKAGFRGLEMAIKMGSEEIIRIVKESGIRGRGGAGFPTGMKWELVAQKKDDQKYLICNGDEGDPGAFMDRMLLESYPYRVIEGAIIAAYATGAGDGYFYIRAEYPLAVHRIREALRMCREHGYLGKDIMGSGFDFDISIYEGAGAFVCGEESALIESIQGNRGFPHIRPPYPSDKGLWGHSTLVNNTETLAQISYIIRNGPERFNCIGTERSKGTKVFALAGKVARGGLIEVPMGTTINQVVEEIGGGIANGRKFKAVQIGGPSGGCIPASLGDTPIDYESLTRLGAMMGSGGLVVMDDTDCMVDIARFFLSFTQNESCGKCTFCRVGTRKMLDIMDNLCTGKAKEGDLEKLEELARWTKKGSLCALGGSAPNPVLTTLTYFREEYEAHINGVCPTGKCTGLITYSVNDNCIGCTLCAQKCPTDAIAFKPHEKHEIDTELCIKCDACRQVCPEDAIDVK